MLENNRVAQRRKEVLAVVRQSLLHSLDDLTTEGAWWQPAPHALSIARLLQHVANAEAYWIGAEGITFEPDTPLEEVVAALSRVRERLDAILDQSSDADLEQEWTASRAGPTKPTLGFITKRLMQHELYHQAQIDTLRQILEPGWGEGRRFWQGAADAVSACP